MNRSPEPLSAMRQRSADVVQRAKKYAGWALLTSKPFRFFRWLGIHLTPVHFYSPVPDIREVEPSLWEKPSALVGVEMWDAEQQSLMENCFASFQPECTFPPHPTHIPHQFFIQNGYFGYVSAVAMYSLVRQRHPQRIVEVGAGNTTYLLAAALERNAAEGHPGVLVSVEPYPNEALSQGFPGLTQLIQKPVQQVDLAEFTTLQAGDILSIDTSHAVRTGGDVNFLFLEVLPRLAPGVLIHIHDIFLPDEYPHSWLERRTFWTEQYLLHAFLIYNKAFRVIWGQRYAELRFPALFKRVFGGRAGWDDNFDSYSFWIERNPES